MLNAPDRGRSPLFCRVSVAIAASLLMLVVGSQTAAADGPVNDGEAGPAGAPAYPTGTPWIDPSLAGGDWLGSELAALPPIPPAQMQDLIAKDAADARSGGRPFRIGVSRELPGGPVTPTRHGKLFVTADGRIGWRLTIQSLGARAIGVNFAKFDLKPGAQLLIGSSDPTVAWASYTGRGPIGSGSFSAPAVPGGALGVVYLEYQGPIGGPPIPEIELADIAHIYRGWDDAPPNTSDRGPSCLTDVMCRATDGTARDAVGAMVFTSGGSQYVCTGTLVNDSDTNSFVAWFLTADHCISTQAEASSLTVYWKYQTNACNGTVPNQASLSRTIGATLLSHGDLSSSSDYCFLRLADDVNQGQTIAGYTAGGVNPTTGYFGIHHPGGMYKRFTAGLATTDPPICPAVPLSRFAYLHITDGVTQGGSSGSALFECGPSCGPPWRIIGQLYGSCSFNGCATDCSDNNCWAAVYGRFSVTYPNIATWLNSTQTEDSYEPNDTLATAAPIGLGSQTLRLADFDDYFSVTLASPTTLQLSADYTESEMNLALRLYSAGGTLLAVSDATTGHEQLAQVLTSAGTYIVRVSRTNRWGGAYTLSVGTPCPQWTAAVPPRRGDISMCYDSARGRIVLFGGRDGSVDLNDTWEWDGTVWRRVATGGPPARGAYMIAYDSGRQRVVLFGGVQGNTLLSDTWEWDGITWVQRASTGPSARYVSAMAYDANIQRTVLFGGFDGNDRNDTWEWNGSVWQSIAGSAPPARESAKMAYDSTRQRLVLFGGYGSTWGGNAPDTWERSGATWSQASPSQSPAPRRHHAMAYDAARGLVILHGGYDGSVRRADSWGWNGTAWTQLATNGPSARLAHACAFDSARGRVVIFGGGTVAVPTGDGDTWTWDGSVWTQRVESPPAPREKMAAAFDSVRNQVVCFGGANFSGAYSPPRFADTWLWNGSAWSQYTGSGPSLRTNAMMAFDAARGSTILFGGYDGVNELNDMWIWNGSAWAQPSNPNNPSGRDGSAITYDVDRQVVLMFGGFHGGSVVSNETWTWNGSAWAYQCNCGPSPRESAAMAFDPVNHNAVLFGGSSGGTRFSDTWTWNGTAWTLAAAAGAGPSARSYARMVFDASLGKVVLMGGYDGSTNTNDVWAWDGGSNSWTQLSTATIPGRAAHVFVYDSARGQSLVFGGYDGSSQIGDTWLFDTVAEAPTITQQPQSQSGCGSPTINFSITAGGTGPLTYQWRKGGSPLFNGGRYSGATTPTFTITGAVVADNGSYDCVVFNTCTSTTSTSATLAVAGTAPSITVHPQSLVRCAGASATMTVTATGNSLSYQWRRNSIAVAGATSSSLSIPSPSSADSGSYDCIVSNPCGSATSNAAVLTISVPPAITTQPVAHLVCSGADTTFVVVASGDPPPTYQWRRNGVNLVDGGSITDATGATMYISGASAADAGSYDCVVSNFCGTVTSAAAALTVGTAPAITQQPIAQSACPGANFILVVQATGGPVVSYQWRQDGVNIPGATMFDYIGTMDSVDTAGSYDCVVTTSCGTVTSAAALVTLDIPPDFTTNPAPQTVCSGQPFSFSVVATGTAPISYQWRRNGVNISGATSATYAGTASLANAGSYNCTISNTCGGRQSPAAALVVNSPATITSQPTPLSVYTGDSAVFTVAASGTAPISYLWRRNGISLVDGGRVSGASTATLTITNTQVSDSGSYDCNLSNICGPSGSAAAALTVSCPPATWTARSPLRRFAQGMAYDTVRGRTVCFGGRDNTTLAYYNDTWEWDGSDWSRTSTGGPSARVRVAMAYDAFRGVTVLYGGSNGVSDFSDTWEWNGTSWTQSAAPGPSARRGSLIAYDSVRHVIVLFGGANLAGTHNNETWEYNGTWTYRGVSGPSPRQVGLLAYDPVRQRTVLYGGYNGGYLGDTWEWNGSTWTNLTTGTGPTNRGFNMGWYDSARQRVVLVGGYDSQYRNDVWEWNGTAWSLRTPGGTAPSAREFYGVYDTARSRAVLFGGIDNANETLGDTWELDSTAWSRLGDSPPLPRQKGAAAFDSIRNEIVMYGGDNLPTSRFGDTWTWNGTAWNQKQVAGPPVRTQHAMAFDSARGNAVIFGGLNAAGGAAPLNETWIWNGSAWSQPANPNNPSPRYAVSMAYDADRQNVVLFGGVLAGGTYTNETWTWDGTTWTARGSGGPAPRSEVALAWDPVHHVIVLHGGYSPTADRADTWTWNGTAWTQVATTGPSARYYHQMVFDAGLGKLVLFGGNNSSSGIYNDLWTWDGAAWATLTPGPGSLPPQRSGHTMVYDPARGNTLIFGGSTATTYLGDTWLLTTTAGPGIAQQPQSQTACAAGNASFTVTASGPGPYTYLWRKGGVALSDGGSISGSASAALSITAVQVSDAGSYDCIVSNPCGSTTTAAAMLSVQGAAPSISGQPQSLTRCASASAAFTVTASGGTLTYQWRKDGNPISGATGATYSVSSVTLSSAGSYDCVVTNSCGSTTSNPATLTVNPAPTITSQPSPQTACVGGSATFTIAAAGDAPLSFDWLIGRNPLEDGPVGNGVVVSGAHTASLTISNLTANFSGFYSCIVSNSCASFESDEAELTIGVAPVFTGHPGSQTVNEGQAAVFAATVTGTPSPSLQWRKNSTPIPGATGIGYTITAATLVDAGTYDCVATGCITVTSNSATLTVRARPVFTLQPQGASPCPGDTVVLTAAATGDAPLTYQWRRDGVALSDGGLPGASTTTGAATPTLTLQNVATGDSGAYTVVVTSSFGVQATSQAAVVSVTDLLHWSDASSSPLGASGGVTMTAFDSHRRRVVALIRPSIAPTTLQTWEFDPSSATWSNRAGPQPPSRSDAALSYDAARRRVVLFGGFSTSDLGDTWEYDGVSGAWMQRTVAGPPARRAHGMTYDSVRLRTVMFGGTGANVPLGDTWEYDGATGVWIQRSASGPQPRGGAALTYDSSRQRVVLFGGFISGGYAADTWDYDGTTGTWTQRAVAGPSARSISAMTFDSARQRVVLFGGVTNPPPNGGDARSGETWDFDGSAGSWNLRSSTGPTPRGAHGMLYDPIRQRSLVLGGDVRTGQIGDVWEFNGVVGSWTPVNGLAPSRRFDSPLVYDSARQRVVLFSGYVSVGSPPGDTWEYDTATRTWTQRSVAGPSGRRAHCMAYDSARQRTVLFGGLSTGTTESDTWEFDGAAGVWMQRPVSGPSARLFATMVYDAARQRLVMFGGTNSGSSANSETWEFDGAAGSWSLRTTSGPSARYGHSMTYDAHRQRVVLFGGGNGSSFGTGTWVYDGATGSWTNAGVVEPDSRYYAAMTYDASRRRSILFGGSGPGPLTWQFDGSAAAWSSLNVGGPFGQELAMAYDSNFRCSVMFGGTGASGTWELSGNAVRIVRHPIPRSISPGAYTDLTILADGAPPLTYQWRRSGVPISDTATRFGTTTNVLSFAAVSGADYALYDCIVTDSCRSVTSAPARITCPADFNQSGTVSVQDIFDFLAAYFAGDPRADFNGSGVISVQDIFDFLAAYFAGCA